MPDSRPKQQAKSLKNTRSGCKQIIPRPLHYVKGLHFKSHPFSCNLFLTYVSI
nr:MAG TPA: hypothetical protein [Caudoviricetes sp.]